MISYDGNAKSNLELSEKEEKLEDSLLRKSPNEFNEGIPPFELPSVFFFCSFTKASRDEAIRIVPDYENVHKRLK